MSGEVEEKNRTITQLEERVRELEGNRKFMDSVDAGFVVVLFYLVVSFYNLVICDRDYNSSSEMEITTKILRKIVNSRTM